MVLWRIEYVWLSAVWWKQLDLSDGHMERNLLNDSIPSEKSQEEGFISVYLILAPSLTFVGVFLKMNGNTVTEIYNTRQKFDPAYYAT